jgi:hypothetical protein
MIKGGFKLSKNQVTDVNKSSRGARAFPRSVKNFTPPITMVVITITTYNDKIVNDWHR